MKKSILVSASAVFFFGAFAAQAGVWVNQPGVGTSPETAADYFDTGSWSDGTPVTGNDQTATITGDYIKVSQPLSVFHFYVNPLTAKFLPVVLGENEVTIGGSPASASSYFWNAAWYVPIHYTSTATYGRGHGAFCAPFRADSNFWFADKTEFRYDRFALDTNPVRTNAFTVGGTLRMQANMNIYCPEGLDESATSSWTKTPGSSFLHRKAGTEKKHALPVGAPVSGSGIPGGTFLRRVFDDDTIELSAAIAAPVEDDDVTFAAFSPDVTQTFVTLTHYQAYLYEHTANKYRAQDKLYVRFDNGISKTGSHRNFAVETVSGFYPGIIEYGSASASDFDFRMGTCILSLTDRGAAAANAGKADNFRNAYVYQKNAESVSRIIVTNNLVATIGHLGEVKGSFIKDGEGRLVVAMTNQAAAVNTGSITVEAGTLRIDSLHETEPAYIPTLTIKAGAVFEVPPEGFACDTLVAEEGAVLSGSGPVLAGNLSAELVRRLELRGGVFLPDAVPEEGPVSFEILKGSAEPEVFGDEVALSFATNAIVRVRGAGSVRMLLVGGGGGGGAKGGGGGGGGGVIYTNSIAVRSGFYALAVGQGGRGAPDKETLNTSGGDSSFLGIVALGGGAGGTYGGGTRNGNSSQVGCSGGSGGGGSIEYPYTSSRALGAGSGTAGQGSDGGHGQNVSYPGNSQSSCRYCGGGGGGGAGGPGLAPTVNWENDVPVSVSGANGGDGVLCEILGSVTYGGGGGGGGADKLTAGSALGGAGGGGNGAYGSYGNKDGDNGVDGLGGGGGGGSPYYPDAAGGKGGNGGRGTVILRWTRQAVDPGTAVPEEPLATGGALRCRRGYAIHTFTNDGSFVLSEDAIVDVLLVGGGGGGGARNGGGGGAGGVLIVSNLYLMAGTHAVTIGAGGTGAPTANYQGNSGSSTVFGGAVCGQDLVVLGGGGGGSSVSGKEGASSGGCGAPYATWATLTNRPARCLGYQQGHPGGIGVHNYTGNSNADWPSAQAGGGGGAGTPGGDATTSLPGDGGDGLWCDFSGRNVCYGGGGGGGASVALGSRAFIAKGGEGGGGGGGGMTSYPACTNGGDGADGFGGGGGGGGGACDGSGAGGRGGSGVVIIRYRVQPRGMMLLVH